MRIQTLAERIDYLTQNESKKTIAEITEQLGITYDEYEKLTVLAMPAIKFKNEYLHALQLVRMYQNQLAAAKVKINRLEKELKGETA